MRLTLLLHILAGTLGLVSGYAALFAVKGGVIHRRAGLCFVASMLLMCASGFTVAVGRGVVPAINVPAAVLTAYLIVTGFATMRRPWWWGREATIAGLMVAFGVAVTELMFTVQGLASGAGTRNGVPLFPFVMFGLVGAIAAAGDLRLLREGMPTGPRRLARHLWRMSFALFIAALSFFIGQAKVIPEALRMPWLLAIPVLTVPAMMFYWLWRVRRGRAPRGVPERLSVKAT